MSWRAAVWWAGLGMLGCAGAQAPPPQVEALAAQAPAAREPAPVPAPRVVVGPPVAALATGVVERWPLFGEDRFAMAEWVGPTARRALLRFMVVTRGDAGEQVQLSDELSWVDLERGAWEAVGQGASSAQGGGHALWWRGGAAWLASEQGVRPLAAVVGDADERDDAGGCLGPRVGLVERERLWVIRDEEVVSSPLGAGARAVYPLGGAPWRLEAQGGGWVMAYVLGPEDLALPRCHRGCGFVERRGRCGASVMARGWTYGTSRLALLSPAGVSYPVSGAGALVAHGLWHEHGAAHVVRVLDGVRFELPDKCAPLGGMWGERAVLRCEGGRLWLWRGQGRALDAADVLPEGLRVYPEAMERSEAGRAWVGVVVAGEGGRGRLGRLRLLDGLIELGVEVERGGDVQAQEGLLVYGVSGQAAVLEVRTGEAAAGRYEGGAALIGWEARVVGGAGALLGQALRAGCGVEGSREPRMLAGVRLWRGPLMRACVRRAP